MSKGNNSFATVGFAMGKHFLKVAGIVMATEGQRCRDVKFHSRIWDKKSLHQAAEIVNAAVNARELCSNLDWAKSPDDFGEEE